MNALPKRVRNTIRDILSLRNRNGLIGVFSDDFAAVDVREELCKTKPPEKANSEGLLQSDNNSEEIAGKK